MTPELKRRGIITLIDSDGDIEPLIPWFQGAGIEGIPAPGAHGRRGRVPDPQAASGLEDGGRVRQDHHAPGQGALRAEFDRIRPAVLGGGYIPSVDHQTPPAVSVEDYILYVEFLKEFSDDIAGEYKAELAANKTNGQFQ